MHPHDQSGRDRPLRAHAHRRQGPSASLAAECAAAVNLMRLTDLREIIDIAKTSARKKSSPCCVRRRRRRQWINTVGGDKSIHSNCGLTYFSHSFAPWLRQWVENGDPVN